MTEEQYERQYESHIWLSRMWDTDGEIKALIGRRDDIVSSMSGIGKYDAKHIPTQNGENTTETKNIEFSFISAQIEKLSSDLAFENIRTIKAIDNLSDPKLRGMLKARYLTRRSWVQIGKDYHYEKSRIYGYRGIALDAIRPFVPDEEVAEILKKIDERR